MNLFILDKNPNQAAKWLCDQHIVKMAVETAQILSTVARHYLGIPIGYRATHINHPVVRWVANGNINRHWAYIHGKQICIEYARRYGRVHASAKVIIDVMSAIDDAYGLVMVDCWNDMLLDFPCCVPDQYKIANDPISSYRLYYAKDKIRFARYNDPSTRPPWIGVT